jgi:hypothetical protein
MQPYLPILQQESIDVLEPNQIYLIISIIFGQLVWNKRPKHGTRYRNLETELIKQTLARDTLT